MTKKIIIGNWKMNPISGKEASTWFDSIAKNVSRIKKTEVAICPPFVYIDSLSHIRTSKVKLGAQDSFTAGVGPFTGEVSPEMLYALNAKYVILGHSERRELGEGDQLINKKIKSALVAGLVPILCVGEKERDESHQYFDVVKNQVRDCLKGVAKNSFTKIIIAYEPVWALSSTANRRDATAHDSREMAVYIRKVLSDISSPDIASKVRILYGGSVSERNCGDFLEHGGVDGLLVGKTSLDPKKFGEIVKICEALKN